MACGHAVVSLLCARAQGIWPAVTLWSRSCVLERKRNMACGHAAVSLMCARMQGIWPAVTLRSRASVRNARISGAVTLTLFGALKVYKQLGWSPGGVRPAPLLQHCREAMSPNGVSNTQV